VIQDGVTGRLVPFFAVDQWVEAIDELLGNQPFREKLGKQARNYVIDHFDLRTKSVPKQLEWIKQSA
jgi:glycosyltransferase involved in cell wall biosynthesis